jgi:hypothetical protein
LITSRTQDTSAWLEKRETVCWNWLFPLFAFVNETANSRQEESKEEDSRAGQPDTSAQFKQLVLPHGRVTSLQWRKQREALA